jgi:catechol 2,3-dioxygenase-like lactoylglutathione lyase family enzyme
MKISHLDHLVLTVRNIEKTVEFYQSVLAMEKISFGDGRVALLFGDQKINLHQQGREFEPNAGNACSGSADLCFILNTTIDDAIDHLTSCGVEIIEGPVARTGARGPIVSIYFRDPDQNLIEVSTYEKG